MAAARESDRPTGHADPGLRSGSFSMSMVMRWLARRPCMGSPASMFSRRRPGGRLGSQAEGSRRMPFPSGNADPLHADTSAIGCALQRYLMILVKINRRVAGSGCLVGRPHSSGRSPPSHDLPRVSPILARTRRNLRVDFTVTCCVVALSMCPGSTRPICHRAPNERATC